MIISGGQTGADRGGLLGAKACGIKTGGFAPLNWMTENGSDEEFMRLMGLQECKVQGYAYRTRKNIRRSDGTLILCADSNSPGTKLTKWTCARLNRPVYLQMWHPTGTLFNTDDFRKWFNSFDIITLNVAGNRESKAPGIEAFTKAFIIRAFGDI